ncbi:redoxin family protein [Pedobacter sp. HDW13]|uniref:TlpA disulfide reductase family protein n=1 Tax=Pedobacter sp. HDW13 TaxID=2714940 RepID=UPI00140C677B|nr:TlpA disulfide reductase family protein [Pedobacter sp. HDW13]QIL41641.1 redoxin family protein [Pedobacter sp. HDW13]
MRIRLFAVALLLSSISTCAQKTVTIEGALDKAVNSEPVLVYKPVDGRFNVFFTDTAAERTIRNGKFKLEINLSQSGFIRLQSKSLPKLYFFAEPGENIQINYQKNKDGVLELQFYGKNAGGNNLIASKQLLNNSKTDEALFQATLSKSSKLNEVVNGIDEIIKEHTTLIQRCYQNKTISAVCLAALVAETEQKAMAWIEGILLGYFHRNENIIKEIKLSESDCQELINILYKKYDPFNHRYFNTTTAFDNAHSKSELIRLGIVKGHMPHENAWGAYDKDFEQIINELSVINFAPDEVQSNFIGNALLIASVFKPMDEITYARILQKYIRRFPGSAYIALLSESFISAYMAKNQVSQAILQNNELLSFKTAENKLTVNPANGLDTITRFQSIIKNCFKGTPVFVDFWASWCSPCLAEFRYEPQLHEFLAANNIKMLYISLDNTGFRENWKKLLSNYKLDGYHYLANQQVKANAEKMFQGIPRYMLFDKDGNLVEANALRPSSAQDLYKQIKDRLK